MGAIPHWLYFVQLRRNNAAWRQAILWTSGVGSVLALIGLVLGIVQYRTRYAGLMRWHYVTGVVFGVFTLTWVFSGLLSMQPWDWTSTEGGSGAGLRQAFTGRPLELASFPVPDAERLAERARRTDAQGSRVRQRPGRAALPRPRRGRRGRC